MMHYQWIHMLDEQGGPGDTGLYRFGHGQEPIAITYEQWQFICKSQRVHAWELTKPQLLDTLAQMNVKKKKKPSGPDIVDLILEGKDF